MATGKAFWAKFFVSAGIPPNISARYAADFVENRIQKEMLGDLTKELLNEMGIKTLGDVIAILKAAKRGFSDDVKEEEAPKRAPVPKLKKPIASPSPPRPILPPVPVVAKQTIPTKVQLVAEVPRSVRPPAKSVLIIREPEEKPSKARIAFFSGEGRASKSSSGEDECHMVRAVRDARKSRTTAPDADEYIVKLPTGKTEKSREILRKLKASASEPRLTGVTPNLKGTVFTRLGETKKIRLTVGSSEVSSTTDFDVEEDELVDLRNAIKRKTPVRVGTGGGSAALTRRSPTLCRSPSEMGRAARFGLPVRAAAMDDHDDDEDEEEDVMPSIQQRLGARSVSSPAIVPKTSGGIFARLG